jgi:pyruvate formate lyase activating enzyme
MSITGLVFNVQRFCIHDGPGVRTTIFLKGCPADCWWCHNPEARSFAPELGVSASHCIACGTCLAACPTGAAGITDEGPIIERDTCTVCASCADVCPTESRVLIGREWTPDEVAREMARDAAFYEASGGGVTFSGGEPLAQPDFLVACLQACRDLGLHTAVDTCGAAGRDTLLRVAELTDLFLYDVKVLDDAVHRKYVGISNRRPLDNLRALADAGADVWVRVPVVPGVNDDFESIEALGRLVAQLPRRYPVWLLPYHAIGADKYRRLGEPYRLEGTETPSVEAMAAIADFLREQRVEVRVGT